MDATDPNGRRGTPGADAAPLGRRWLAFGLDYLVILAIIAVVAALGALGGEAVRGLFTTPGRAELAGFIGLTLPVLLYFALCEASRAGGTLGKRRLGLRVVGPDGARLSFGRSLLRSGLKFAPWELAHASIWRMVLPTDLPPWLPEAGAVLAMLLALAYLLSPLGSPVKQALYDRIAGTRVIERAAA